VVSCCEHEDKSVEFTTEGNILQLSCSAMCSSAWYLVMGTDILAELATFIFRGIGCGRDLVCNVGRAVNKP
jgi:hypothetical protein